MCYVIDGKSVVHFWGYVVTGSFDYFFLPAVLFKPLEDGTLFASSLNYCPVAFPRGRVPTKGI